MYGGKFCGIFLFQLPLGIYVIGEFMAPPGAIFWYYTLHCGKQNMYYYCDAACSIFYLSYTTFSHTWHVAYLFHPCDDYFRFSVSSFSFL